MSSLKDLTGIAGGPDTRLEGSLIGKRMAPKRRDPRWPRFPGDSGHLFLGGTEESGL